MSVISWGLRLKLGDEIEAADERGRPFRVRLVAGLADSVFQGSVLVSEARFLERFPSSSGARAFLVDAPAEAVPAVTRSLENALADRGLELVPARDRLEAFLAVQNAYLSVFLALGGIGLLIGSAGRGAVVFRNVLERRAEFALMRAVGFSRRSIQALLLWEHGLLLALGLAAGVLAAGVAVLPAVLAPGSRIPFAALGWVLGGTAACGLAWAALATLLATRGDLLEPLRNE
jgi:ABC-type antimicrobial peptide transport system permease subunit